MALTSMTGSTMSKPHVLALPDGRELAIACEDADGNDVGRFEFTGTGVATITVPADVALSATVSAVFPLDGEVTWWTPTSGRSLGPDWGGGADVRSMRSAPAGAVVGPLGDSAVVVMAASANVRRCQLAGGVREEDGTFRLRLTFADIAVDDGVDAVARFDVRGATLAAALADVTSWWTAQLDRSPAHARIPAVPDAGRVALFSAWYAMHQNVSAASVEQQAALAAKAGLGAIIVDDGWQTTDRNRGFAFCGDWEVNPEAFPDMAAHVARVQAMGMKYLLWFGAPLIGRHSSAWTELDGKLLGYAEGLQAGVFDPRFPEVRELIVGRIARAVTEWGVDGLKIDFIDSWAGFDAEARPGTDCDTVDEGAERFLDELLAATRDTRPDVLIEFRQGYIGPRLWRYGTLLRAGDCPADAIQNRQATLDVRVLAGDRAVHADMLMWHPKASAAAAAAQLTAILFSVPQISVRLDLISDLHRQVLAFWLGVAARWRDVLQLGTLATEGAAERFTQASASNSATRFVVAYADGLVRLPAEARTDGSEPAGAQHDGAEQDGTEQELVLVNARAADGLVVTGMRTGPANLIVHDCAGTVVSEAPVEIGTGPWWVPVPAQGLAVLTR
jgi:alpha-galactosidase